MLDALITSKTRLKLLLKFFLNSSTTGYLRSLEPEFGESTNAIRQELNRFEDANLLVASAKGNKKLYTANTKHPLFADIHNLLLKHTGLDSIIEKVVKKIGDLSKVYLVGDLAQGINSMVIDLWFVGSKIDRTYLMSLVEKTEGVIDKKVRYLVLDDKELQSFLKGKKPSELLLIWETLG